MECHVVGVRKQEKASTADWTEMALQNDYLEPVACCFSLSTPVCDGKNRGKFPTGSMTATIC
jgi:hypothetical protein